MAILARYESESGVILDALPDPNQCLNKAIEKALERPGSCLRFIDPYGDTWFNHLQRPILVRELKEARERIDSEGTGQRNEMREAMITVYLDALIHFINSRLEERSVRLAFIGD